MDVSHIALVVRFVTVRHLVDRQPRFARLRVQLELAPAGQVTQRLVHRVGVQVDPRPKVCVRLPVSALRPCYEVYFAAISYVNLSIRMQVSSSHTEKATCATFDFSKVQILASCQTWFALRGGVAY